MSHARIKHCLNGPEYWQWFDAMPKSIRDRLNNAKTAKELLTIWQEAVINYGSEIERKLKDGKD